MFNWISQIGSVTRVNLRSIPERKGATLAAAVGIAGVVAVFVGVLSIAEGFRAAMKVSGPADLAIVLRSSADTEMTSGLSRDETRLITDAPGIALNRPPNKPPVHDSATATFRWPRACSTTAARSVSSTP